jgi:FAD/FMN-containing dehydrogenase
MPSGMVVTPDDQSWDDARQAWNLAVDQRPAAVAVVESADDVAAVMTSARQHGLPVAAQGTGHAAAPMGSLADTILLKTERLRGVRVDPATRTARVAAGEVWLNVVGAAAEHGLATLAGSSPDVGVAGYALGGGMSWLSRTHGLCANNLEAVEVVTPDGQWRRVDGETEPDLFWALRGGGGSFGVVTAFELRLLPLTEVYAGVMFWPMDRGAEVLHAWRELTNSDLPDALTTVGRYLQLPPMPDIPEPVRGKSFAVVEVIHLGSPAEADALLTPLRALEPGMDTIETMPVGALSHLHMDPEHPVPAAGDGLALAELPAEAVDELVRVAGAGSGSPLLSVEVRHLGGEIGRARPENGALASIDAEYGLFSVGMAPTPEAKAAVETHAQTVKEAMGPWQGRHMYMNFAETSQDPSAFWQPEAYDRLRRIKADVDPTNLIRSNHPVPLVDGT